MVMVMVMAKSNSLLPWIKMVYIITDRHGFVTTMRAMREVRPKVLDYK